MVETTRSSANGVTIIAPIYADRMAGSVNDAVEQDRPPSLCPLCQTLAAGYSYQHPRAEVVGVQASARNADVRLHVDWGSWNEAARQHLRPASLGRIEHPHETVVAMYELTGRDLATVSYRL